MKNDTSLNKDFNISTSNVIKGWAILIMLIHHCFGFQEWYIDGVNLSIDVNIANYIASATKICISLFAFVTGWSYYFNERKTYKYSFKKIKKILFQYWEILFLIFYPIAVLANVKEIDLRTILVNLLALDNNIVYFAWYVYFYVFFMLIMPFLHKILDSNKKILRISPFIVCWVISVICYLFIETKSFFINDVIECFYWLPSMMIGYMFARLKKYHKLYEYIRKINVLWLILGIFFILLIRSLRSGIVGINLDIIYAPIVCLFIISMTNKGVNSIKQTLSFLGKYSMNIWLFHGIFYSPYTAIFTQKIIYDSNKLLISFFTLLILSLGGAIGITTLIMFIKNIKNFIMQSF